MCSERRGAGARSERMPTTWQALRDRVASWTPATMQSICPAGKSVGKWPRAERLKIPWLKGLAGSNPAPGMVSRGQSWRGVALQSQHM